MQASDIKSALLTKKDAPVIANPPRNGINVFCRQP